MTCTGLSILLFGADKFFGERAQSTSDEWDFRPKILPPEFLNLFKEIDPAEGFFKVHVFKDRIEVWPLASWLDSTAYRNSLKGTSLEQFNKQIKEYKLEAQLKRRLGLVGDDVIKSLATAIKNNECPPNIVTLFKLESIINEYHAS